MAGASVMARTISPNPSNDVLDMVCVGFGPAALTIAVALEDWLEERGGSHNGQFYAASRPKTLFIEKQNSFNWHAGMLLHSAKMQISFLKDLATVRDPSSRFTFLNYLKVHGRLRDFSRFNTFLPSRLEFSDYLRWAAGHFDQHVKYGHEVLQVRPIKRSSKVTHFEVDAKVCSTGQIVKFCAKQVVIAAGGSPVIPTPFRLQHLSIIHSSQYETTIDSLLPDRNKAYRVAVIGSGQSAAEIFDDLATRLPRAYTALVFRDSALRPSDDSPFVNEVFDPTAIDSFFKKANDQRLREIQRDRSTNYSVVRLELLEKIYGDLYLQDIQQPDPTLRRRSILPSTEVVHVKSTADHYGRGDNAAITLVLKNHLSSEGTDDANIDKNPNMPFDAVILATGYRRNSHLEILRECQSLSQCSPVGNQVSKEIAQAEWSVQRDYSLKLKDHMIEKGVGIWLQGCNEATHGLSDSLLSVLATRSGELVQSMFGVNRVCPQQDINIDRKTLVARL